MTLPNPVHIGSLSLADKCKYDFGNSFTVDSLSVTAGMMGNFDFGRVAVNNVNIQITFPDALEFREDRVDAYTRSKLYKFSLDRVGSCLSSWQRTGGITRSESTTGPPTSKSSTHLDQRRRGVSFWTMGL